MSGFGVQRCATCGRLFQWLRTKWGRRLPFNHQPVPIADLAPGTGWAVGPWVIKGRRQFATAPLSLYPAARRAGFRAAVTIHDCPAFQPHIAAVLAHAGYDPTSENMR